MGMVAGWFIRAIIAPLGRFHRYTARIAAGDYSLIVPARKYRDEFSQLAVAINRMIHELELRQQQLMQSGKMAVVGTLTSGIAHELNNPLNNIGLTTEALIEDFAEHSEADKLRMLDQIHTQVERASSTVRNLLDFTRKDRPVFTSVSIPAVIQDTARLLSNEMEFADISFRPQLDASLPQVLGNPRNLQQVFLNLMLNSIQAMPKGGCLTVSAAVENEYVRVDVQDTGIGIKTENLAKVFDPFFSTKEPGQGTGLGLAVSYGIIEAHNGRITVQSEEAKGTTFSVLLPLQPERQ
jgi:two-component system NtrC family sensor kinase